MTKSAIGLLTVATFLAAGGQLLLKVGATGRGQLGEFINLPVGVGLVLYGVGTVVWIYTLANEQLVQVYAFTALTFVLVYLAGVFFLGERLSWVGFIGVGFVLAGLFLITHFGT